MPRQNRRRSVDPVGSTGPRGVGVGVGVGIERIEEWRGDDYVVRVLAGAQAGGPYRCPGCDQPVAARTPHVVVWPAHDNDAEDRRHWHTVCWAARDRRTPDVQRGRGTPRH
jgi:hypothetical protein